MAEIAENSARQTDYLKHFNSVEGDGVDSTPLVDEEVHGEDCERLQCGRRQ